MRYLVVVVIAAVVALSPVPDTFGVIRGSKLTGARAARVGAITETALGSNTHIYLFGLAPGPDGNLWFADLGCAGLGRCAIGRITANGSIIVFTRGLRAGSVPFAIAPGPDGNLWFTDEGSTPAIGRITPAGRITEFSRGLKRGSEPFEIVAGPRGSLWFTIQGPHPAIGRITPRGRITEFTRGLRRGSVPFGIAAGRHGRLWFTDHSCAATGRCALGRISRTGRIAELTAGLRRASQPLGIADGPGGDMWFADASGAIGQITPAGRVTERSRGLPAAASPVGIAAGPDGSMWFTDEGSTPALGRITPRGRISEFSAGLEAGSEPALITTAPDGRLWFSDEGSLSAIGRVATGAPAALRAPPVVEGSPGQPGPLSCRAPRWAAWARVKPSIRLFSFDGYRWLRAGAPIPGGRGAGYRPAAADRGRELSCRVTVTYGLPFLVTTSATSAAVTVHGAMISATAPPGSTAPLGETLARLLSRPQRDARARPMAPIAAGAPLTRPPAGRSRAAR